MKTVIIYSNQLRNYDFGIGHPFRSNRFENFLKLYKEKAKKNFELIENDKIASDEELELWHSKDYIQTIKAASSGLFIPNLRRYISQDNINPLTGNFPKGIEEAARAVVKGSILAVDYVQNGYEKAINIGGGLHHAKSSYGEGFCIYNDVVIAIKHAIKKYGLERILVLDTDAHAGNGTCEAFYSDPKVLFIDLHQKGIYPGTGSADEIGTGKGRGFTVNIPLASRTGDKSYELIFDEIIFPLAQEYGPELIVRNGGSDPHFKDGLTSLALTLEGFRMIGEKVRKLSELLCKNKCIDLICSGYNPDILPKAWLALISGLTDTKIKIEPENSGSDIKDENLDETKNLINEIRENLKPHWKSMKK